MCEDVISKMKCSVKIMVKEMLEIYGAEALLVDNTQSKRDALKAKRKNLKETLLEIDKLSATAKFNFMDADNNNTGKFNS
jgi:hypothetical protein